jgi:predicted phage-related endonuclease
MSTQINPEMIDLDPTAIAFLTAFTEAKAKVKEWQEKADIAQEQVKYAMGDSEIGLVNGKETVRWTTVESRRIDVKKLRELLPEEAIAELENVTISRRFTVVED